VQFCLPTHTTAASLDPRAFDIAELNKAFHLLDINGDGFISSHELQEIYNLKLQGRKNQKPPPEVQLNGDETNVGKETGPTLESDYSEISIDVLEMMRACDHDKDGRISYEEFVWGMTGQWIRDLIGTDAAEKKKSQDLTKLRSTNSVVSDNGAASGVQGSTTRPPSAIYSGEFKGRSDADHQSERSVMSMPTPIEVIRSTLSGCPAAREDDDDLSLQDEPSRNISPHSAPTHQELLPAIPATTPMGSTPQ